MTKYLKCAAFAGLLILSLAFAAAAQGSKKGPAKCAGANNLNTAEITELLALQNRARADHKLAPLTWDCKLADLAQAWASRGKAEHRDDTDYGENVFVSGSTAEPVATAVQKWLAERPYWTNKSGSCQSGKTCTHYTQIVWKRTAKVGCGINRNVNGKWKVLLVCNYDPAGNTPGPAY